MTYKKFEENHLLLVRACESLERIDLENVPVGHPLKRILGELQKFESACFQKIEVVRSKLEEPRFKEAVGLGEITKTQAERIALSEALS